MCADGLSIMLRGMYFIFAIYLHQTLNLFFNVCMGGGSNMLESLNLSIVIHYSTGSYAKKNYDILQINCHMHTQEKLLTPLAF